jgi:hypothetical protein
MFKLSYIRDFISAHIKLNQAKLEPHEEEQVMYRALQCPKCVEAGKCLHCGCSTPHIFFAPNRVDAQQRWGAFLTQEE